MSYLIISILFLSALSVLMRHSVGRGASPLGLNLVFRGSVAVYMALPLLLSGQLWDAISGWQADGLLIAVASAGFWVAGIAAIKSVQLGPLGISWTILRCSMVLPVLVSILYWRELDLWPVSGLLVMRLLGIALAVATVVVCGTGYGRSASLSDRRPTREWALWMAAAFVGQGVWEICLRATHGFPDDHARSLFLICVFGISGVLTLPAMALSGGRLGRTDVKYGLLLGVCALFGTGCRVLALKDVDGTVVFPLSTVSIMLFAQAAGRLVWKERIAHSALGLALGIAAVLLLTLK